MASFWVGYFSLLIRIWVDFFLPTNNQQPTFNVFQGSRVAALRLFTQNVTLRGLERHIDNTHMHERQRLVLRTGQPNSHRGQTNRGDQASTRNLADTNGETSSIMLHCKQDDFHRCTVCKKTSQHRQPRGNLRNGWDLTSWGSPPDQPTN
mgnify:CR=1 FL=1